MAFFVCVRCVVSQVCDILRNLDLSDHWGWFSPVPVPVANTSSFLLSSFEKKNSREISTYIHLSTGVGNCSLLINLLK